MVNNNLIEQSIPGFSGLTSSASSIINDLLSGNASAGRNQNSAARFGVSSGMPGSGVSNAFGYDLHRKDQSERQQRGIDDLLKLVTGYSGTVNATPGELLNKDVADRQLSQASYNANADRSLAQQRLDDAKSLALKNMNAGWVGQGPLAGTSSNWSSNTGASYLPLIQGARYTN